VTCPITSRIKGYPFEVAIPNGLRVSGVVLADEGRRLSWPDRDASLIGRASSDLLDDIREKIAVLIEIA